MHYFLDGPVHTRANTNPRGAYKECCTDACAKIQSNKLVSGAEFVHIPLGFIKQKEEKQLSAPRLAKFISTIIY